MKTCSTIYNWQAAVRRARQRVSRRAPRVGLALIIALTAASACLAQAPVGSEWTYQGKLDRLGSPLNGTADVEFKLYDAPTLGIQIGPTQTVSNVSVVDGLFTVDLDFGVAPFNGEARWLEIAVRSPAGSGAFTTLDPRQPLTAVPYAMHALGPWVKSGTALSYNAGNVGIGVTAPRSPLSFNNASGEKILLAAFNGTSSYGVAVQNSLLQLYTDSVNADVAFGYVSASTFTERMRIKGNGNVGIGTATPASMLDVAGTAEMDGIKLNGNGAALGKVLVSDASGVGTWQTAPGATQWITNGANISYSLGNVGIGTTAPTQALDVVGSARFQFVNSVGNVYLGDTNHGIKATSGSGVTLYTFGVPIGLHLAQNTGNVGIGTATPASKLDVAGTAEMDGIKLNGNGAALGKVLVSDASGVGTWQTAPGATQWITNGANISYSLGNVGIGTTNPVARLHVLGPQGGSFQFNDFPPNSGNQLVAQFSGVDANGPQVRFESTVAGFADIGLDGNGSFVVEQGDIPRLTVTTSGNVGIGTTNPTSKLDAQAANTGLAWTIGVHGKATGGTSGNNAGVYGEATGGANAYAGYFLGNVNVTGVLSKGAGAFKIDHPLDPAGKYLWHSFVESPDMMNIYNGNVVTDDEGFAVVRLPEYFEALNRDFRYQLTTIGSFSRVMVSKPVQDNSFVIRSEEPRVQVSWQVTGIRHDAFAEANRIPNEQVKPANEQGKYIHPELFGIPAELGVGAIPEADPLGEEDAPASGDE